MIGLENVSETINGFLDSVEAKKVLKREKLKISLIFLEMKDTIQDIKPG